MEAPLVFVRSREVFEVPPVCTVYWGPEDWARITRRVVEPLVLDGPCGLWTATGERNAAGQLLYRRA